MLTAMQTKSDENATADNSAETATEQSERSRAGAPRGNLNAARHGLSGGNLPRPFTYVLPSANELRRDLEGEVLEVRGEISVHDASAINRAFRWERAAQVHQALAARQEDAKGKPISQEAIATHIEAAARCSDARHRAIVDLRLNEDNGSADRNLLQAYSVVPANAERDAASKGDQSIVEPENTADVRTGDQNAGGNDGD